MKIFHLITSILFIIAFASMFYNWKIGIIILLITSGIYSIPHGPQRFLTALTGYLFVGGVIYLFFDWKIGAGLIILSLLVAKILNWSNKSNS
jgi:hypothetical protein